MNTPLGLAFIVGQLGLGGAEQQLYHLLAGLDRARFRPVVINLGGQADAPWEKPIKSLNIPLWHIERSFGRAGRIIQVTRRLRFERIRIVHGWVFHANPYSAVAGRLAGVPLRLGSMRGNYNGIPDHKLLRRIGYWGLNGLVTNSTMAADQVRALRLTEAWVRVVPNGVHHTEPATEVERRRLKAELSFADTDRLIGSIGRLDNNKNHGMLLRAFAGLAEKSLPLRLVIFGDGPLRMQLAAEAERLGVAQKIFFPGAIPQAARYLAAMEVCCLTSYTEGMPNLVMEAAAAGLPVVSTTCGDSAKLIEHGVTGYLVSPNDVAGLSEYLDLLLSDPDLRRRLGQAGREKMRREFSVEAMVGRMVKVYEDALIAKGLA